MDKSFAGDNQTVFVRNGQRDVAEGRYIMGNDFPFIAIASGGAFDQLSVFVYQFDGKTVQLQHEQCFLFLQERNQILYGFCFS